MADPKVPDPKKPYGNPNPNQKSVPQKPAANPNAQRQPQRKDQTQVKPDEDADQRGGKIDSDDDLGGDA